MQDPIACGCSFRKRCRAPAGPGSGSGHQRCGSLWMLCSDGCCWLWTDSGCWYVIEMSVVLMCIINLKMHQGHFQLTERTKRHNVFYRRYSRSLFHPCSLYCHLFSSPWLHKDKGIVIFPFSMCELFWPSQSSLLGTFLKHYINVFSCCTDCKLLYVWKVCACCERFLIFCISEFLLHKAKPDLTLVDVNNNTALHLACSKVTYTHIKMHCMLEMAQQFILHVCLKCNQMSFQESHWYFFI